MADKMFEEFMKELVKYLRDNDMELFSYLDNCFRNDDCDRENIETAFEQAYMHWLFFRNISSSAKILKRVIGQWCTNT